MKGIFSIHISKYCFLCGCILLLAVCSCTNKPVTPVLFQVRESNETGLNFINRLTSTGAFNMFKYMYFYNGAGVGAGDFNNDGLIDLFFASNQAQNKIYLNHGKLSFTDVTAEAGIPHDGGWSTGVSLVDINNDGLLDIYVCRVGNFESLHSKNQLLVCKGIGKNGIPYYRDEAKKYGLDFSGFSTQAAFFDYDMDGDLDMFLLNHSVHQNGNLAPRQNFMNTYHPLSGDRIYRNNGNESFTDVTKESAINSSAISYGLGISVSDINLDGWPDMYVGNDFHENDYQYINQRNGTFKDELTKSIVHTSKFSMGVDVADMNNDGFPDIISMDMLAEDPYILKRSLGGDDYDISAMKINYGYNTQYSRNNLQFNRGNGLFSEIGLYAGIAATDWSWAPLWMDFDNDGLKDLFISNGIPKRMNDIDYINFVTQGEIQEMIGENNIQGKYLALINKFPEIKLPNKFYHNNGDLTFSDKSESIGQDQPTFSNGAVYADFDNDGDLDIVVNNIDAPALLYENKTNIAGKTSSVAIVLKGSENNINAVGAKVVVFAKDEVRTYEKNPAKGFMSSMETPLLIGMPGNSIDSALLIWPDNSYEHIDISGKASVSASFRKNLPQFNYHLLVQRVKYIAPPLQNITEAAGLEYIHRENRFSEFDREPLIPHMVSTEGPALATADINHDGLEDIFIGSSRDRRSSLLLQQRNGQFIKSHQPGIDVDSMYENTGACFADVNNDGNIDLIVASGGNEFFGKDFHNTPRVYLNDGHVNFVKKDNAFSDLFLTASCVAPYDFNKDGFVDLFFGGRAVPWEYGQQPRSYLLLNDKTGRFTDVTSTYASELSYAGFVTSAKWFDIDKDGDSDLLLSLEWGSIDAYINTEGKFTKKTLTDKKGWWNFVLPCDIDQDGDIDLIAGNLGLNSRLKASADEPLRLYFNDFDGNGKKEQILTYYVAGKEIPFANKSELERQMPVLKKKFLYGGDFAKATLSELFTPEKLKTADVLTTNYLSSSVLINTGNLSYVTKPLPTQTQLSSMRDAVIINANNDSLPDILIVGNYYDSNIEMGQYDADFGTILINQGNGGFFAEIVQGVPITGQVRHISKIKIGKQDALIMAKNNDSAMLVKFAR